MNRFLRLALLLSLALTARAEEARPNFVIFIADDLTWHDVASFGGPTSAATPHLDRLAGEGMRLTGFFSPASVCSPTRQALLTGLYPVRSGAYPNHAEVRAGTRSLPHYLGELGYRTALAGKTHFDPKESYPFDVMMPMVGRDGVADQSENDDGDPDFKRIESFITETGDQPFLLYVATHEQHGPHTKGNRSRFDPATVVVPPHLVDTPETRRYLVDYYAEVEYMDAQVGALIDLVRQTGREDDTLFLFVSEQGNSVPMGKWSCYDPGIRVAAIARWPGRIPSGSANPALVQYVDVLPTLIALAGGNPAAIDTGCPDAHGATGFDGRDMGDVLTGQTDHFRDYVFAQHTARGINNGPEAYGTRAVRDDRWKLIVNLQPTATFSSAISRGAMLQSWQRRGEAGDRFAAQHHARYARRPAVELYDLQSDTWELANVADDPAHLTNRQRLQTALEAWMTQQGDRGDETEREALNHQAAWRRARNASNPDNQL